MKKSTSVFQRLKIAPVKKQIEPTSEPTVLALSVTSDFKPDGDNQMMKAVDAGLEATLPQDTEGVNPQSGPAEQACRPTRCRSIMPKRKRNGAQRKNSGDSMRPRPSAPGSRERSFTAGPRTLIEQLEAFGNGMRTRQLAILLGIGRSTLYEWVYAGTIPAYHHRGVVMFDGVVIANWLRQQAVMI